MPFFQTEDSRWQACLARDRAADGAFIVGVRTTGIYCRPICPGRPKRENVRFYADIPAARAAGLRACKRCTPDTPEASLRAQGEISLPYGGFRSAASSRSASGEGRQAVPRRSQPVRPRTGPRG